MNYTGPCLALFGGTFNPPHFGHINPLLALIDEFQLTEVRLLPSPIPPHKSVDGATFSQRLDMLKLVCEEYPQFTLDLIETQLPEPSYTVRTLQHFRQQFPDRSIVFIMGQDSINTLDSWYEWQRILELSHIIVMPRKDTLPAPSEKLKQWIKRYRQTDTGLLQSTASGQLFFAESPITEVSSTLIRKVLNQALPENPLADVIPSSVLNYCRAHKLYLDNTLM
ncbi:nicotinate-nucleotide adenylyltransferase [Alteromonas facilis]|uniref:nicotinate-nucleotide adenylyltransferase n=1 Tax=Alteromonas facilis TaxID=2048004 RepID=UPI000C2948CD|nr:nicotinate-nucleotide adenylyltransferase [Alteromonas facilis]